MLIFLDSLIDLKVFSPTAPLGIFILIIGLIFSGMIFYIIYEVYKCEYNISANIITVGYNIHL